MSARIFAGLAAFLDTVIGFLVAIPVTALLMWSVAYLHMGKGWLLMGIPFALMFMLKFRRNLKEVKVLEDIMKPEAPDA